MKRLMQFWLTVLNEPLTEPDVVPLNDAARHVARVHDVVENEQESTVRVVSENN
jgi:hypothetical protein